MRNTLKSLLVICLAFAFGCSSNNNNPPSSNNSSTMTINSIYSMALGNWRLDSVRYYTVQGSYMINTKVGSISNLTSTASSTYSSQCISKDYVMLFQEATNGVLSQSFQSVWFVGDGNCTLNNWPNAYRYQIALGGTSASNIYSAGNIETISSSRIVLVSGLNPAPMLLPQITNSWRAYWTKI